MTQITHNNHYVPQFYLKQWSDDGTHIWAYLLLVPHEKSRRWKKYSIKGIAFRRDLYTSFDDEQEIDNFEKRLEKDFEIPAIESLLKVTQEKELEKSDWEKLAKFVGAQDVRTPLSYIESVERWKNTLPDILQNVLEESIQGLESGKLKIQKSENSESKEKQPFSNNFAIEIHPSEDSESNHAYIKGTVTLGRALWLEQMEFLLSNTIRALLENKWSLVYPAEGFSWFTSDHPVIKLNYYGNENYDLKGGWGKKKGNIFMPLSPKHMLFTQIGDEYPDRFTASSKWTQFFQRLIAERAFRWIFAKRQDFGICKLRPREINGSKFNDEEAQWQKWHNEQSQSEIENSTY